MAWCIMGDKDDEFHETAVLQELVDRPMCNAHDESDLQQIDMQSSRVLDRTAHHWPKVICYKMLSTRGSSRSGIGVQCRFD